MHLSFLKKSPALWSPGMGALRCASLTVLALAGALAADPNLEPDYQAQPTPPPSETQGPPMLGVEMSPPPASVLEREGISADRGVLVRDVFQGTAAAAMGMQPGDVITNVGGQPISSMTDLRNEIGSRSTGEPIQVEVSRNGKLVSLGGTLKEWPAHIPWEPIDAQSESNYRDMQRRRQERQEREDTGNKEALANLEAKLAAQTPRDLSPDSLSRVLPNALLAAPGLRHALARNPVQGLSMLPGWSIDWSARGVASTRGTTGAATPVNHETDATSSTVTKTTATEPAWRFQWSMSF